MALTWAVAIGITQQVHAGVELQLPATVLEGNGTLTNAGRLNFGGIVDSNAVFTLQSSDAASLTVPTAVTLMAGQSNATFDVVVGDNWIAEGDRVVAVWATVQGYAGVTNTVRVIDNDPDHLSFGPLPSLVDTNGAGCGVLVTALNADGSVQTNFNLSLTLLAEGVEGNLPMEPSEIGPFSCGQKYTGFRVLAPGHAVRLRCAEYPGSSLPFTVIVPPVYTIAQPVADIAWHEASQTLLASVPGNGGAYSNSLVAIDLSSGLITNVYPVGVEPGQIEMSPGGNYLYLAISNQAALQRFDLNTRLAGIKFGLGTNSEPVRFAFDFCVPPGMADSVVVEARDRDYIGNTSLAGVWRYNSGTASWLYNLEAAGGWLVESLNTGTDVLLSPPLARGSALTGTVAVTNPAFSGTYAFFRGGQVLDESGNFYSPATLALLGSYPGVLDQPYQTSLPEVSSDQRRVFFLSGYFNYGAAIYTLKAYDRDLLQPLCQFPIPSAPGSPTRFVRCGTNRLAYVTGNGQLWFVRLDALQPTLPAADLSLSLISAPSPAVVGVDYTFSLCLSNAGPGLASVARVTNAIPANVVVKQTITSGGAVVTGSSGFNWTVGNLAAGSSVTLDVTVQFNNAGWQTNTAWALGFETDPVFANNTVRLPVGVQLSPAALGTFVLNFSSEDLVYDPNMDRLLLSVASGLIPGQSNGLAVLNPYNGLTDTFAALGKRPSRLARSDNGQYLYVSLPDDGLVRRVWLPSLSRDLEFGLGGEMIYDLWYPNYAAELAAVPGAAGSVVAWRVRRAGPMATEYGHGLALFENGTMRANTTDDGGSWTAEFDTQTGTLYAFNNGDLRRCTVNSNGVSFVEQYPPFYGAGSDVQYAAGRLFSTAGRVIRPDPFAVAWTHPGAEGGVLVAPDAVSGRVFYLVQESGWQIRAYDFNRRQLLGSLAVTNLLGTPSSLIRWGTNGLAFRTSENQLFMVRSALVSPAAGADLAVSIAGPSSPAPAGSNTLFTVTITNGGPAEATAVQITNVFSPAATPGTVAATAGAWDTNSSGLVWSLDSLAAGGQASLSCTVVPKEVGVLSFTATVSSGTSDPERGNNSAVQTVVMGPALARDSVAILPVAANDMVWSPALQKLLLTGGVGAPGWSGGVIAVDPVNLAVELKSVLGSSAGPLTISKDESLLYAGIDYGVSALRLPEFVVTNSFLVDPAEAFWVARDLELVPGSNQACIAGLANGGRIQVRAYTNGVSLSAADSYYASGVSLEFGDDPSLLYSKDYGMNGFRRYSVGPPGLTLLDSDTSLLPLLTAMDLVWGEGRIYTSMGKVIDPSSRTQVGTIAGIPAGSRVVYDPNSRRVFYLCPGVNQANLMAFDGPTLLPAGTRVIQGVSGSLGSFVRWGVDGFAATSGSGQLVLFRSGLVATNPPADVSIGLVHSAAPYVAGSNITASLTITNVGPNAAPGLLWNDVLPAGITIVDATASAGTLVLASNTVSGTIESLGAGESLTVNITFVAPAPGIITNQVGTSASAVDPQFANNVAAALLWVQPATGLPATLALSLPVKDIERDPVRPLLYASFGSSAGALADSVVVIDAVNGSIGTPVHVGSDPGRMAASPDGQILYVALDGAGTVQKLTLPGLDIVSSFAVPQNQVVTRMAVSPADHEMVAIRRAPGGRTSLHVAGVQRPGELSDQDLFAFAQTTGELFGCDGPHSNVRLYRLNTGPSGLSLLEAQPGKQSGTVDLRASGALLFFDRGMIVEPGTRRVRALLPVPANSLVEGDAAVGRAFYASGSGSNWNIRAFDIGQGIEVGSVSLPGLAGAPRRLLRWGSDGLALCVSNAQVVLLRGQLVPTNAPVDVVLCQSVSAHTPSTNQTVSAWLRVTNSGPFATVGLVVTQSLSLPVTNVVLSSLQGSASYTNGTISWQVGELNSGGSVDLTTSFRPLQVGSLTVAAAAYHNLNDSFWGNNSALNVVTITNTAVSNLVQVRLNTRELAYDPARDLIYASTPASNRLSGNLVVALDPTTGDMKDALPAGSEPGQMALSDDGRYLSVAVDGAVGVQRFDLQTRTPDLSYAFGTNDIYFAYDLEPQPGHPETVVASLGSYNLASPYPSDVWLYDNGVPRPAKGGPSRGLTFAGDGTCLFGYVSPGIGYSLMRMWPGTNGFRTDSVPAFTSPPGDLKFQNGRIYSYSGQVADPNVGAIIGSFTALGPQAIDAAAGRAYYLAQRGTSWELRAFDCTSFQPLGTQTVASVQGTPSSLIRCGADRLAFRTSFNQVFVIRSPLVSTNVLLPANVAVAQTAWQDFTGTTETLRFLIAVTNGGPANASNLVVAIIPPGVASSTSIQLPQGTSTNRGGKYVCKLGVLPAGQSLELLLNAVITNTGYYSNYVSVSAATPDPNSSDNVSFTAVQGLFFQRPNAAKIYNIASRALAYDQLRGRLFAALATVGTTNRLAWFDPQDGLMQGALLIDLAPTSMLITDDGRYLYLSGTQTGLVQRIDLSVPAVDQSFVPPGASGISSMALLPGNPHSVALTYWVTNTPITAVFDDVLARPDPVLGMPYTLLAASTDAAELFGYASTGTGGDSPDVFRMSISGSGLQLLEHGPTDTPYTFNHGMAFGLGRLFFENGEVLNPSNWVAETSFALPYYFGSGMDLLPTAGLAAFLTGDLYNYNLAHIAICAIEGRQQLTQMDIRTGAGGFGSLVWCGADRFAFRSPSEIIFVRSSALRAADLVLRGSAATNQVCTGQTVSLQLVVSNAGPYSLSAVALTNRFPTGMDLVSASLSQGTFTTNSGVLIVSLGAMATNGIAVLNLSLSVNATTACVVTNATVVCAADLPDPVPFNNVLEQQFQIILSDTDNDGLPDTWELAHGLNPGDPSDALLDSDGDGTTNLQEYRAGTDPCQFDGLRILSTWINGSSNLELVVLGTIGRTYTLENSSDLVAWSALQSFLCSQPNQVIEVPFDRGAARSFYRLHTTTNAPVAIPALRPDTFPPQVKVSTVPGYLYAVEVSTNLNTWSVITKGCATASTVIITNARPANNQGFFYRAGTRQRCR